jgi:hypothetical protein
MGGPIINPKGGATDGFQFVGLHVVGDGNSATAVSLDPLLKPGVVEAAKIPKHVAKGSCLCPVRLKSGICRRASAFKRPSALRRSGGSWPPIQRIQPWRQNNCGSTALAAAIEGAGIPAARRGSFVP